MSRFGPYRLIKRLASGGMGEIYLATLERQSGFAKAAAIKRILPQFSDDPSFVAMFTREARIAAQLNHQNVVQIFDYGQHGGAYFIAMEYVHGRDLRTVLEASRAQDTPLPPATAATVASAVASGLSYAHRCRDLQGNPLGIVHRDLSPQNILVSYEGEIKLTDFGLAQAQHDMDEASGQVQGKYAYMSPEQTRGWELDSRSDIFALGIVIYELFSGVTPFQGDTVRSLIRAIRSGLYTPLSALRPDLPEDLDPLIACALAVDPDARYPDVSSLQADLDAIINQQGWRTPPKALGDLIAALCPVDATATAPPASSRGGTLVADQPIGAPLTGTVPATQPIAQTGTVPATTPIARTGTIPAAAPLLDRAVPKGTVPATAPVASSAPDLPTTPAPPADAHITPAPSAALEPLPSPAPDPPSVSQTEPAPTPPRGLWLGVGAAVCVLGVGLGAYALKGGSEPSDTPSIPKPSTPLGASDSAPQPAAFWTLDITSEPAHPEVIVNGTVRGRAPLKIPALPGGLPARLELRQEGYKTYTRTLELGREGGVMPIQATLKAERNEGQLVLDVKPLHAKVFINGTELSHEPGQPGRFQWTGEPGSAEVHARAKDYFERTEKLEVPNDSTLRYALRLLPHFATVEIRPKRPAEGSAIISVGEWTSRCRLPCTSSVPITGPVSVTALLENHPGEWRDTRTGRPGTRMLFEVPVPKPKPNAHPRLRIGLTGETAEGIVQRGMGNHNLTQKPTRTLQAKIDANTTVTLRYIYDSHKRALTFNLSTSRWSKVALDGRSIGNGGYTPVVAQRLTPGQHTIALPDLKTRVSVRFELPP